MKIIIIDEFLKEVIDIKETDLTFCIIDKNEYPAVAIISDGCHQWWLHQW